jgi:PAS domain S-box-containing protein
MKNAGIPVVVRCVDNERAYADALGAFVPQVIVYHHPAITLGLDKVLNILQQTDLDVPVVLIAEPAAEDFALGMLKAGVTDYVLADRLLRLPFAINNAVEKAEAKAANGSEQRFKGLFENSIDMVTIADLEGNIIFASENVTKILGYSKQEYVKVRFEKDFIHPDDKGRQELLFVEVRKNPGKVYPFNWALRHKNGNWVWLEGTVCNLLDVEAVKGVVANFRDVTQRRNDNWALQKSQANLSAIIENTTDLVYSLDKNLKFITFNELFKNTIKQVYGFDVIQGGSALSLTDSLDPSVAKKWSENYSKALAGTPLRFVNEYPVPDGKVYLSYSINPIWQDNKVIGLSVFSRDITKEKLDEIAMQQSEANMRSVFENTDVAINLFDMDLKLVSFNSISDKHAMLFFGRALKTGASAYDYFPEERWPTIANVIKRVKAHETVVYEIFYPRLDGDKEWMEIKWFGVADKNNEITGIILIYRNITQTKNAEIEREKMTNDLMRRNEDLEQFTYIISHNLRAPVANIKGLSDLLLMDSGADADGDDTLMALSSSVGQLDKVIIDLNNILQVGKQVNDRKEKILLAGLFEEISLELRSIIQQNRATIHYDFANVEHIFTLKGYLYSIFQNLVVNSIKYRKHDVVPVIHIAASKQNDHILFTYTDNGKGIDLERNGKQLFGLYKRFDFSVEGKGVGLFMVKMQVQNLGGTIAVQSRPGEGVTFTIILPA